MKPLTANELRIGNYIVFCGHIGEILLLTSSMASVGLLGRIEPDLSRTHDGIEYDLISPIPLTEEWLVKFWFEATVHGFSLGGISIGWQNNGKWIACIESLYKGDIIYCSLPELIESVHQLQNLYHALTGEELTLKP